jgi:hypothetical protein
MAEPSAISAGTGKIIVGLLGTRSCQLFLHFSFASFKLSAKLCLKESSRNATGRQQLIVPPFFRDPLLGRHPGHERPCFGVVEKSTGFEFVQAFPE